MGKREEAQRAATRSGDHALFIAGAAAIWMPMTSTSIVSGIAFAILAAASRHFLWSTETRLHILAYWCAAAAFEIELRRPLFRVWPTWSGFCVNAAAATIAIIAVKWSIEGFSWIE